MGNIFSNRKPKRVMRKLSRRRQFCPNLDCKIIKAKDVVWIVNIFEDCTEVGMNRGKLALSLGLLPADLEETNALVNVERSGIHGFLVSVMSKWISKTTPESRNVFALTTALKSCRFIYVAGKIEERASNPEESPFRDRRCACNKSPTSTAEAPNPDQGTTNRHSRLTGDQARIPAVSNDIASEQEPLTGYPENPLEPELELTRTLIPTRRNAVITMGVIILILSPTLAITLFSGNSQTYTYGGNLSSTSPRIPTNGDSGVDGNVFHNISSGDDNCTDSDSTGCKSGKNISERPITPEREHLEPAPLVIADHTSLESLDCKAISNFEYTILPTDPPQLFFGTCNRESVRDLALKGGFIYAQFYQIVSTNLQYSLDTLNLTDPYICQSFTRPWTCTTRYEFQSLKKIIFWKNVSECTDLFLHLAECGNYHKVCDIILDQPPRTRAGIRGLEELRRAARGKLLILYTRS